jgi:membrane associated rhomboid family serine protease
LKKDFIKAITPPAVFVIFLWMVMLLQLTTSLSVSFLGVLPRQIQGLPGIIFHVVPHSGLMHLFFNSIPLLVLGTALFYFFRKDALLISILLIIIPGILVWIFARPAYHIGASSLVYGLAFFIFFIGIFSKQRNLSALSLIVVFLYGSLIWGIFPAEDHVSWEGHLSGAIAGVLLAILYKKKFKKKPVEDEEHTSHEHDEWDFEKHFPGKERRIE